ncbi:MAG: flagellar export chaperone FlgN [Bacillota bacterium]
MDQLVTNLHKLIDKKIELFNEILAITVKQKDDIINNSADNIEELVNSKQQVINRIDEIDKAFKQLFDLLKKSLNVDSLESINPKEYPALIDLKGKVSSVMAIAGEIMKLENENRDKMNMLFNEVKAELRQMKTGKKSLKAYESPVINNDGVFIDKKK